MPSQTFTGTAVADASAASVWESLNEAETWEAISGVEDIFDEARNDSGHLVGFKFRSTAAGKQYVGKATPGGRVEEKSLTWDIATSEIKGEITVDLHELESGTRVDVTMRVESVSMMASFGFPIIASVIGNGFQQTVDNFAGSMSA